VQLPQKGVSSFDGERAAHAARAFDRQRELIFLFAA
jgi:hypothetical protein